MSTFYAVLSVYTAASEDSGSDLAGVRVTGYRIGPSGQPTRSQHGAHGV